MKEMEQETKVETQEEDQKDDLSIKIMEALCDELEIQEDSVCVKFKRGA